MAAQTLDSLQMKKKENQYIEVSNISQDSLPNEEQIQYIELSNVSQVNHNDTNINTAKNDILKELREIKEQMQKSEESNKKIVTKLTEEIISLRKEVTQLKARDLFETDSSLLPSLPFWELTTLKDFDEKLFLDDKMRAQLKCVVQKIGGEEVPVFVRLALKQIESDELAINLTWRETSEKPSIQNFAVFAIIKGLK
ncbi:PREDICTED: uncharacterized protein LOC108364467 [Rhagoletis zephyria]|uniref:uncharacterized protein LOC108364467 n=1 Tax=Rhagoletis zephyria TaxID=28612 RepID=UPI00081122A5|nr:PREDICTED: uncharacterized protein LOC108364467 [Rhagoletis zephyria]